MATTRLRVSFKNVSGNPTELQTAGDAHTLEAGNTDQTSHFIRRKHAKMKRHGLRRSS